MTDFVGWSLPCGAVVKSCKRAPFEEGSGLICVFDRYPITNDNVKTVFLDWTFLDDGRHCIGMFDPLNPPGDPIDPDGQYWLGGRAVTILTTQALGNLPVIAQARDGQLLRFSRYGRGEAGILEK